MWRRLLSLVAPEGLVLLAAVVLDRSTGVRQAVAPILPFALPVVWVSCALLAWRLRRTRAVLACLVLALAHPLITTPWSVPAAENVATGGVAARAAVFLLPLNLLAFGLVTDRGLLSRAGLARLSAILVQAMLVALAAARVPVRLAAWLEADVLPARYLAWPPLSQPVLLAFSAAIIGLAGAVVYRPDPIRRGLLWVAATLLLATHTAAAGEAAPTLYPLAAGVILIVAVVESSFALAYRDGLTGLPSRRAFDEALAGLGKRYAIAMVDIDRFKGVNDRFGHDVGDQVLRMVAKRLGRVSGRGRAFRYGGEEFALIFAGKGLEEIVPHLERVRRKIEQTRFTLRAPDRPRRKPRKVIPARGKRMTLPVTVSVGAAARTAQFAEPDQVVKAADAALYRAKNGGRNRVVA